MATYYIDFEGGNDANAGTSFATRWKTITNGATAARIAPGDEIRIMASPDPTSIGSATWTGGGRPLNRNISSSTNATPIVINSATAHGLVPGDYVSVINHNTNTNANGIWKVGATPTTTTFEILQLDGSNTTGNGTGTATGNITKANNLIVKTATPLVQNIALCGGLGQKPSWTASTNVTCAQNISFYKEGNSSAQIDIAAAFTTGKAAYYTLPSTLNLSGYQQVTFWVRLQSGSGLSGGQAYLALCTDTTGDTVVHQCPVPALGQVAVWVPVTVDFGANLNSAIRSVAFYVVTDLGAQSFYLDNIIACKAASAADSVTLQSLVSKSDGTGDEAWYPIQSINYDVIMLANANSQPPTSTSLRGYSGATETVTTYKRETIKTTPTALSTTQVSVINDDGISGSPITFSGGWNRTDMSTQTGRTWLDGLSGNGYGLYAGGRGYVNVDKIDLCRYNYGVYYVSNNTVNSINSIYITACSTGLNIFSVSNMYFSSVWVNNNGAGLNINTVSGLSVTAVKNASNNTSNGVDFQSSGNCNIVSASASNCGTATNNANLRFLSSALCSIGNLVSTDAKASYGIFANSGFMNSVNGGYTSGNSGGASASSGSQLFLNNFTINESAEVTTTGAASVVYSNRNDDTDNNSWVWFGGLGTINQQTSVVDSPATTSWLIRPTGTGNSDINPVRLKLGTVVCAANSLVTVTARMRRDNTALTMRLCCPGGQISGVSSDVTSDMTAAANTWETVTITFTPTKAGGVDIYAYAFGGTTYSGYVCNLTASQA